MHDRRDMRPRARLRLRGPFILFFAAAVLASLPTADRLPQPALAQEEPVLGIDAEVTGNTAASLSPVEPCLAVSNGDSFDVDLIVHDVRDLLAWEIYVEYDPAILQVLGRDVSIFQAGNPDSNVFDISDALPDDDGLYRAAAADTADPPSPDSGSGQAVLLINLPRPRQPVYLIIYVLCRGLICLIICDCP